jgi:hypothetical protein
VSDRKIDIDIFKKAREEILEHPMRKALTKQICSIQESSTRYAMNRNGDLKVFYDLSAEQEELVGFINKLMFSIEEGVFVKYGLERSSSLDAGAKDDQP